MKREFSVFASIVFVLVIVVLVFSSSRPLPQTQQTIVVTNPMPDSINVILKKACTPCHSGSNPGATGHFDLTKWANYTVKEQVKIGGEICSTMTDGSMPPKMFRQSKPEMVQTEAELAMVCKWIASFTPKE